MSKMDSEPPPVFQYKRSANSVDPLVNFQLNNPIPPIKRLLGKLFANEAITIKIPVLTAIALLAFGLGGASGFLTAIKAHLVQAVPAANFIFPSPEPTTAPDPWIADKLFGTLSKQQSGNFYLILQQGDVIQLIPPTNVNLDKLVGKKILAEGLFSSADRVMKVRNAEDLILFVSVAPVPTVQPTPTPSEANEPQL